MRSITDAELKEGRAAYQRHRDPVSHWDIPAEVILQLAFDLKEDDEAVKVRLYPYCHQAGGPQFLAARVVTQDGKGLASTLNDIRPCPPFCD